MLNSVLKGERSVIKMNAKRILAIILTALMVFTFLTSCGGDTEKGVSYDEKLINKDQGGEASGLDADENFRRAFSESAFDMLAAGIEDGKGKNMLLSPLSIYSALAMTALGAKGETQAEMSKVLGSIDAVDAARYLYALKKELDGNERIKIALANSLWMRENAVSVEEDFLKNSRDFYDADAFYAKFDKETLNDINSWIEEKTDGMIKDMLSEIPESTVMYLINALCFEGEWVEKYQSFSVREGEFASYSGEKREASLMYSEEQYYLSDGEASGFIKPYSDTRYGFVALLPDEGMDVYDYAKSLTAENFSAMLSGKERAHVNAAIPEFKYEYEDSLRNELKSLGMNAAFDNADLTGIGTSPNGDLFISDVFHKTFIEVSPEGTKAGAATVVAVDAEGAYIGDELKTYEVHLDRPFVYAITDLENGISHFVGILADVK